MPSGWIILFVLFLIVFTGMFNTVAILVTIAIADYVLGDGKAVKQLYQ